MYPTTLIFCAYGVNAQKKLLKALNSNLSDCKKLTYRGNGWPGYTVATNYNGTEEKMEYSESWGKILGRDLMPVCRICIDGIGELADISCGDTWYSLPDGTPDFSEHDGRNVVFARTEKGRDLIELALSKNVICAEKYFEYAKDLSRIQSSQYNRRTMLQARMMAYSFNHKPIPKYDSAFTKAYKSNTKFILRLKAFLGAYKRILKGKI